MGARGVTLLEVMIALAIVALAFPVLLALRNWDVDLLSRSRGVTTATLLAQEKLFEAEQLGFLPVGEQRGDFTVAAAGLRPALEVQDRAPGFRWHRTVLQTPFDAVREVRIRIVWTSGGREDQLEVTSYVVQAPR